MEILHPVYTAILIILIGFSFLETYSHEYINYKALWLVIIAMIIFSGFRIFVGADYGTYATMYTYYGLYEPYDEIFKKALFLKTDLEVEWLYVLLGKIFFQLGLPFYYFTVFIAIIGIIPKFYTYDKSVVYPALSVLLYMFPIYFTADSGQMRQGVAMGLILLSFLAIKKRNLSLFLLLIYIAMGFHKSSVIFIPAFWLATLKLNSQRIILLILVSLALSPLKVYTYISILESIAPEDVYSGFSDYSSIQAENTGGFLFTDLICIMYAFFVVTFDKETCKYIPYYEYMRNIGVLGICSYFIFRESPIFSSRLTTNYLIYMTMVIPNIIAAVQNISLRRYLHLIIIAFVIFYYFVYAHMQGSLAGFTPNRYHNVLWK